MKSCHRPQHMMSGNHTPSASGPFSALTPSIWPQEILAKSSQKEDSSEPEICYDEFGFRVDKEGSEPGCSQMAGTPLVEDPPQRLRWQAHLEFTHNHDVGDLTWDKIAVSLPRSEKLRSLVLAGIPHGMRPQLWMRLSGALQKKKNSELSYREIVKNSSNDETIAAKQIEKDLLRTMPSNACFANVNSIGVPRLRRVLRALAWLYPEIGYCQGTGMVAACLLLFLEEEDAFQTMCALLRTGCLPPTSAPRSVFKTSCFLMWSSPCPSHTRDLKVTFPAALKDLERSKLTLGHIHE